MAGSEKAPLIAIRALREHAEFAAAVALQQEIWGFADMELLPVRLFITACKVGGQAFGAYDGHRMVAFLLAIPGIKPGGKYYLHSHMLGVLPEYRNAGLGRMLKMEQRADALGRGVDLIEWTFDPLEIKNAFFNIERLGAIVRRYLPNQYGTTSSHLHAGLPTDRLVAEWYIAGERAVALAAGGPFQQPLVEARIALPNDIAQIRAANPQRAREIQQSTGAQFQRHFREGLAVTGVERGAEATTYLLGKITL